MRFRNYFLDAVAVGSQDYRATIDIARLFSGNRPKVGRKIEKEVTVMVIDE